MLPQNNSVRLTLVASVLAIASLLPVCIGPKKPGETPVNWDKLVWYHEKLDAETVKQRAQLVANPMDSVLKERVREALSEKELKKPRPQKYDELPLDNERYKPLCKLFLIRPPGHATTFCSCAFVKPKLVATAARCFISSGVVANNDGMSVYVVQQYGIDHSSAEKVNDHVSKHRNYATDWWFPLAYQNTITRVLKLGQHEEHGLDLAFVKTTDASLGNAHYTLANPKNKIGDKADGVMHEAIKTLGYPEDFRNGQVAVGFEGKLTALPETTPAEMLCIEGKAVTDDPLYDDMEMDGIGGPWILTDAALDGAKLKPHKGDLRLAMFGVYSYGPGEYLHRVVPRTGCGILVTDKVIKIAEKIDAYVSPVLATTKLGATVKAGADEVENHGTTWEKVLFKF